MMTVRASLSASILVLERLGGALLRSGEISAANGSRGSRAAVPVLVIFSGTRPAQVA